MGFVSKKLALILFGFEVLFIILFGVFMDYDETANAHYKSNSRDQGKNGTDHDNNPVKDMYPMFQDVHVMMFMGFGFLMTFLRRYSFSSVGLNMLIAAFVLQWAMLFSSFIHMGYEGHAYAHISINNLLTSDFAAAAVLISFGALLGKTSPLQLIIMAFIEIIIFTINEWVGLEILGAVDVGGSMFVHVFGAYFGLAVSRVLYNPAIEESKKEGSNYNSDLFAMIGTIFLWLYWPSFNSALAPGDDQHRAVINTYLALAACTITAIAASSITEEHGKLDMVHVQNATLAGGVAVGTTADMMIGPWGAMLIGSLAGILSTLGYKYLTPMLASKLKIHDTCGVHNLHGMPGVFAGIAGIVASALASTSAYGYSLYQLFPRRAPEAGSDELAKINEVFSLVSAGQNRSAGMQAGFQAIALVMTLGVAIVGGVITGFILKLSIWDPPKGRNYFDDGPNWETPDDFDCESIDQNDPDASKREGLLQTEEAKV